MKNRRGCPKCGSMLLTEGVPDYYAPNQVNTMCVDCYHTENENYWDRRAIDLKQYHILLECLSFGGSLKDALRVAGIAVPDED